MASAAQSPSSLTATTSPSSLYSDDLIDLLRIREVTFDQGVTVHRGFGRNRRSREKWRRVSTLSCTSATRVYKEENLSNGSLRTVKQVQKDLRETWKREVGALTTFSRRPDGPELFVVLLGWYDHFDSVFLIEEYFDYGDLGRWMHRSFEESEAQEIVHQLLEGLNALHEMRFAHGNLTPENILVSSKDPWHVKIGGLGTDAYKASGFAGLQSSAVETVAYRAPEMCLGDTTLPLYSSRDAAQPAADMWSLGAILFEMLTETQFLSGKLDKLKLYQEGSLLFPERAMQEMGVSAHAIEITRSLMAREPFYRMTAPTALRSPWLATDDRSSIAVGADDRSSLRSSFILERDDADEPHQEQDHAQSQRQAQSGEESVASNDAASTTTTEGGRSSMAIENPPRYSVLFMADEDTASQSRPRAATTIRIPTTPSSNALTPITSNSTDTALSPTTSLSLHETDIQRISFTSHLSVLDNAVDRFHGASEASRRYIVKMLREVVTAEIPSTPPIRTYQQAFDTISRLFLAPDLSAQYDRILTTGLFRAVQESQHDAVKILAALGANINAHKPLAPRRGDTPLISAVWAVEEGMMKTLLDLGADPNVVSSPKGHSALFCAAARGREGMISQLAAAGGNVRLSTPDGWTALHLAAQEGRFNAAKTLLDLGADVQAATSDGLTALHCAAHGGHGTVVDKLLMAGASVDARTTDGTTALHFVAKGGHDRLTRQLLGHGASARATDRSARQTPLHYAALYGHEKTLRTLLQFRAPTEARDLEGQTAMHHAAMSPEPCQINMIRALYVYGAKCTVRDIHGDLPADLALRQEARTLLEEFGRAQSRREAGLLVEANERAADRRAERRRNEYDDILRQFRSMNVRRAREDVPW